MKINNQHRTPPAPRRAGLILATCLLAGSVMTPPGRTAPGDVDQSFNVGSSVNGQVEAAVRQRDGKWIITGTFTAVQGAARGRVARLHADGTTDHGFMAGLGGANLPVHSAAVQSDGKIVIGGLFTTVHGTSRSRIARLHADGSLDSAFGDGLTGVDSFPGYVNAVALQTDGKILIGGNFTSVNGVTRNNIARLNADGSLDATFADGLAGADSELSCIVLQPDGQILISGSFGSVNGTPRGRIARLNANGSLDTSFGNGLAGADAVVFSVAMQTDGQLVIGGAFASVNGITRKGFARLNAHGSLDGSFAHGVAGAHFLRAVALQGDGKVVIGGGFASVNGTARTNLARLHADGTLDTSFGGDPTGADDVVRCIAAQENGLVIVGGEFRSIHGTPRSRLAALTADGSVATEFDNGQGGPNGNILALATQPDGKVIVGGAFTALNGQTRNRIARLNDDGSLDPTFGGGLPGANRDIYTLALQGDGKVVVGGAFTNINGTPRNRLARLNADGTLDTAFGGLPGVAGADWDWGVNSIAIQGDGKIVIGGYDIPLSDSATTSLARLEATGSFDTSFGNGLTPPDWDVSSVALQADGKILIGGRFTSVNGIARGGVARLDADGTLDTTFGDGLSGVSEGQQVVLALRQQSDGKILIGGDFLQVNGVVRRGIARLNNDGTLDAGFGDGLTGVQGYANARVRWLHPEGDGRILVGGFFTAINGVARGGIARLNADGTVDTAFGDGQTGADGSVRTGFVQPDGKVVIGGEFTAVNGVAGSGVARLYANSFRPVLGIAFAGGAPVLQVSGEIGRRYVIEYASELPAGNHWTTLSAFTLTQSPQTVVDSTAGSVPQRFYRLRESTLPIHSAGVYNKPAPDCRLVTGVRSPGRGWLQAAFHRLRDFTPRFRFCG